MRYPEAIPSITDSYVL